MNFLQIAIVILLLGNLSTPGLAKAYSALTSVNPENTDALATADLIRAIKAHQLSKEAQNIEILTIDGTTTLRGEVKDDRERMTIGTLAAECGFSNIKNELTIKSPMNTTKAPKKPLVIYRKSH